MDAFAINIEGGRGGAHLRFVEGDDFDFAVGEKLPKPDDGRRTVPDAQHGRLLVRVDAR